MERLQQIEMGGDDIREALSDLQRALSVDMNSGAVDERANQFKILTGDSQTLVDNIVKRGEDGGADQAKISSSRNLLVTGADVEAMELRMKSKVEDNIVEMGEKVDAVEGSMKEMKDNIAEMGEKVDSIEGSMKKEMKEMKEMMSRMMKMMG